MKAEDTTLEEVSLLLKTTLPGARGMGGPDDSLLEAGMDSVAMVDLLAALEERFGLSVPPEEITQENFSSPRSLASLVRRLKG
jgi:acyl carrier protein